MDNYKNWLGKEVSIKIDRPLGSRHPEYPNLIYPLNYGYLPGKFSEFDGEEIDAYVMGVDKKIDNFTGRVIAVVKRKSGNEEFKLVVAKKDYSVDEIMRAVEFQERYFKYEIMHD